MIFDDIGKKYNTFYDSLAGKYYDSYDSYFDEEENNNFVERSRFRRVHRNLLPVIKEIANRSGFNTNAPESLYSQARTMLEDLKDSVSYTKTPKQNEELIRQAQWSLFENLDYMTAYKLVGRIKI